VTSNNNHLAAQEAEEQSIIWADSETILPKGRRVTISPRQPPLPKGLPTTPNTTAGWVSNRHARSFVAEMGHQQAAKYASTTNKSTNPAAAAGKPRTTSTTAARQEAKRNHNSMDRKRQLQPNNNDAPKKKKTTPTTFRYQEVVRGKAERETLKGYECPECGDFLDAALEGMEVDRHEFMCASRHRARHTPPSTPEGFWELSFVDEMKQREK
jgi:hypothetical protein